nr:PadR family transcriptional regulator [uncultured Rhodoferax sp.]
MSLAHAVLTSLIEKPSSGYELARRFDKSIGYFWHATHQQIYRELARMEEKGWIVSDSAPDAGATRKREYQVLPAGRAELVRWTGEPAAPTDLRDELTVKLRADAALDEVDLRDELRARIAQHTERLAHYRLLEQRDFASPELLPRAARIQHLILKKGMLFEQGSIQWAEEALAMLSAG